MTKHPELNALIVDWDFFFPIDPSWDWAHAENDLLINGIWQLRAADFLSSELPLPATTDEHLGWWERFRYSLGCPLYAADSNAAAYLALNLHFQNELPKVGVWLFDQHHDCGYRGKTESLRRIEKNGGVTCEDWMVPIGLTQRPKGRLLHVVYPDHRPLAIEEEPEPALNIDRRSFSDLEPGDLPDRFDLVFVCRSGAWVPPWEDEKFGRFLDAFPLAEPTYLDDFELRDWTTVNAEVMAVRFAELKEQARLT